MPDIPEPSRPTELSRPVDPARDHVTGPGDAGVTLVEYGDYECPDCGRAYPMLAELQSRLSGRLRFVFRHFPISTLHRHASIAAQAAEAAGAQGKFWPMHDLLYLHQDRLELPDFTHHALNLGLEVYAFEQALASGVYLRRVEADFRGGQESGVRGTPTLFVNGRRYEGAVELEPLLAALIRAGAAG